MIKLYRRNPSRKITFTDVRKTLVGDVGSIRRVFDFLETWGLVNYSGSASGKPLKWDDKESSKTASGGGGGNGGGNAVDSAGLNKEASKRLCNSCKSVCTIACFACEKVMFYFIFFGEDVLPFFVVEEDVSFSCLFLGGFCRSLMSQRCGDCYESKSHPFIINLLSCCVL